MSRGRVLFVDDEEHLRAASRQALEIGGFEVDCLESAERALVYVSEAFDGVIVSDIRMPGMDGMAFLRAAREIDPDLPVVLITGHGDVQLAVEAMRAGAYDFLEKPFASGRLIDVAGRAMEKRRLTLENRELRSAVGGGDQLESRLVGRAPVMVELRQRLRTIAATDADVLIVGETGTGKEVAARALHAVSARAVKPFVAINCAALPSDLMESELFGHEAGAFAGAMRARYGKFEHGQGGVLFLDEIESMPMAMQAKLLQAIENRVVTRLGSNDPVSLDVRFMAASKVDLEVEAAAGRFRKDLLYRLNVVTVRMPPLRERIEDAPRLFRHLLDGAVVRYRRTAPDVGPELMAAIAAREWPGNVRELKNAADRFALGLGLFDDGAPAATGLEPLADRVADFERRAIAAELAAHGGKLKPTYEALRLSRKTLYEKMQKYGLNRADFGGSDDEE
jgi:two-component system C4-dicarboxylate transport response regulator DctD